MVRVGFGYDAHRLSKGRALVLGGRRVPHPAGLQGHSDADVLTHAVIDAILGALGRGDLGRHFPPSDPAYKGISSLRLLERAAGMMREEGYRVGNLDATIVAEAPKLAAFTLDMAHHIAGVLDCAPERVNIKATTTEGMGFCGRRQGMEAFAVIALIKEEGLRA